ITNAHVVEGWTKATVQTSDGQSYKGQVIGYSNKTDVAVISVPELKGKKPATINSGKSFPIGEEIIALGSPNGTSKTTYGYITGKNRSFRSEEHTSELQSRFDLVCRLLLEKKK